MSKFYAKTIIVKHVSVEASNEFTALQKMRESFLPGQRLAGHLETEEEIRGTIEEKKQEDRGTPDSNAAFDALIAANKAIERQGFEFSEEDNALIHETLKKCLRGKIKK
ncbi:MAG: hypothetical protein J7647_21520 [Cyanobacteria bacterium SBLK]|nr:hypothetical protein [Cyanobacteria bacterium SBLK]